MRYLAGVFWTLFWLAVAGVIAWLLGFSDVVRASLAAGHLLDWVMGALCLVWLIVILKAPWDLYFEAHEVAFELQRSRERGIPVTAGREEYVRTLQRRLCGLAIGAHVFSALLAAVATYLAGRVIGYYFAGFYLVATAFRPAVAGYVYLSRKLRAIGEEARYPRQDVVELRAKVEGHEHSMQELKRQFEVWQQELKAESRELRQSVHSLSRELESTAGRLTDNQEVIKGLQALARLVAQSTHSA